MDEERMIQMRRVEKESTQTISKTKKLEKCFMSTNLKHI